LLTKAEWELLEGISYDSEEPIEYVDSLVLESKPAASAYETLDVVFNLYQMDFKSKGDSPHGGQVNFECYESKALMT